MAKTFPIPDYMPDLTTLGTGSSALISGVVPKADGFGPFLTLQGFTQALPAACRGYFYARRSDGSIAMFAGTSTRLYLLNNTDFTFVDVSNGGSAYSPVASTAHWKFAQFNDLVIAVQANTPPQVFRLSSSSDFEDLGGSPPNAAQVAIINRFVMLTGLLSNPRRAQWSDLDAPEVWTAGVGLADFQDLPDGGTVLGVSGGDSYGIVFQQESIRSFTYAPGSAVTFQIVRIAVQDTLFAEHSIIAAGEKTFFISAQGFKVIMPGGTPQPIGKERVDTTFFADIDLGNLQLCIGATDPTATRVYWAYKSKSGAADLFDKMLCYDWAIGKNGKWSLIPASGEYLAALAKPGVTLEQLDAIAPTPLVITGAADNGSGAIRLTLTALSNANFTVIGQNFIVVYGVTGTTEANGTWPFTQIDATHIDLVGSTFTNAYTGGGNIGGSLDALGFSLDSISKSAVAQLSAVTPDHKIGFFSGQTMEAIMETSEQDGEGSMVFIDGVRVLTDSPDARVSIGCRLGPAETPVYTTESIVDDTGWAGQLAETRYAKGRIRIPAASGWTYARGIQPDAQFAGDR